MLLSTLSALRLFWLFRLFQLFRGGDLVDAVLSFAFTLAFSFLVFVVVWSTLARVLGPVIFGRIHLVCIFEATFFGRIHLVCIFEPTFFDHVANTSTSEATRFLPVGFALPFSLVATAFFCQGIDLHVVWLSLVVGRYGHTCLILRVVLQELKSDCCQRLEGVQTLHLKRDSHYGGCLVKEDGFLHRLIEEVSRDRFPLANVLLPFVQGNLISCEL